jgi:prepilin-type N-terminal cleavage/methylation domain-containing protein
MLGLNTSKQKKNGGFTLIEMIGVLAIIAILVAAVAPRIFEAIEDSKVTSASTMAKSVQVACTKYYADMGTLNPILDVSAATPAFGNSDGSALAGSLAGTLTHTRDPATQNAGSWPRFRGQYLEAFNNADAPLGTEMRLAAVVAAAQGATTAGTETNFDLTGDGNDDLVTPATVVSLVFNGVSAREWEKLDAIIDAAGLEGKNETQRATQGRVKYNAGTVRIYIGHK